MSKKYFNANLLWTTAVKRDFETQLIINKVVEIQRDQNWKLQEVWRRLKYKTDDNLPSIYIPFISSSYTGEKKCTEKTSQLLLEQETMPSRHLLQDRDLIMTHRTNPIYHQPQHRIKMESKIGDVFADFFLIKHFTKKKNIYLKNLVKLVILWKEWLIRRCGSHSNM